MIMNITFVLTALLSILDTSISFVSSFSHIKITTPINTISKYNSDDRFRLLHFRPRINIISRLSAAGDGQTSQTSEMKEAELLRLKARQLLEEANAAEESLKEIKKASQESITFETDSLIDIFLEKYDKENLEGGQNNSWMIEMLREKRLPLEKVKNVIDRLLEKESIARGYGSVKVSNPLPGQFNIADTRNSSEEDNEYAEKINNIINLIIDTEEELDKERLEKRERTGKKLSAMERISSDDVFAPVLRSRVKETRKSELDALKRRLAVQVSQSIDNRDNAGMLNVEQLTKETFNISDTTSEQALNMSKFNFMVDLMSVPLWVPSSLLDFVIRCKDTISPEDVKFFKSDILSGSRFYCTSSDYTTMAAIYRGNFLNRPDDTNSTIPTASLGFQDIQERLDNHTELKDRIQMFLMDDPEWRPGDERYPEPKPVIILVPSSLSPEQTNERGLIPKVFIVSKAVFSL